MNARHSQARPLYFKLTAPSFSSSQRTQRGGADAIMQIREVSKQNSDS
jgi:hypothetical protein